MRKRRMYYIPEISVLRNVHNQFDIVTVRVTHKGAVIMLMVLRPEPRCSFIMATGCKGGCMKGIHFIM